MSTQMRQFVFQGAQSNLVLAGHLVAVGVALLFIVALSQYERRLVSKTLGRTLLSLRCAVLFVILLTLLQPTLSWTFVINQSDRILIGIDLSGSMFTLDRHATKGEKLRVARGLELIGNSTSETRLSQWQTAFDAGEEPEWVEADETGDERQRTALADSRREHLQTIFADLDKLPRSEIARRLLTSTKAPLLDQLARHNRVELFVFAGKAEPVEKESLAKVISEPPASLSTDMTDLSQGLQQGAVGNGDVAGTILFTDGRDHAHQKLPEIAAAFKSIKSPVFPILIGSNYRPKDLSIQHLEYPQAVYKGDHPQLKVTLGTVGFEGKTVDVELVADDNPDAEPIRQTVTCAGTSVVLEFDLDAQQPGRKSFTVRTPVLEQETRDDNNIRSFAFKVVDDRAKVLLVDGEARWEFRYLDAALARDDRIDLKQVLFDQPHLGVLPEPFYPRQLNHPADQPGNDRSSFSDFDLVIIGDVSPDQFIESHWQQLLKFVSAGGTVVLSAGKRYLPLQHHSAALEQLLPVTRPIPLTLGDTAEEATPRLRGLPLQLSVDGEQQPMLQFASDLADNIGIWKRLPGQMWALLGDAKPGATVWATTLIPAGRVAGLTADRKFGVIVHQYVGSGQVVWLGIDATWRWRYRVGDEYHHRFWAQLARWAAANKMSAGTDFVRFGTSKEEIEVGEPVTIRARWTQAFMAKFPNLKPRAELFRKNRTDEPPLMTIDLSPVKNQPLLSEGRLHAIQAGEYKIQLKVNEPVLGDQPIETTLIVYEKPTAELSDVSTNRDLLTQIADASGGRLFLPDEVRDLPQMFRTVDEVTTTYEEVTLWDRWPWLIILFTLMMTDWVIRKWNGLP